MKKIYYIYESFTGAFGSAGHGNRLPNTYTNKKTADKALRAHRRNPAPGAVYWVDFYWA